MKKFISFFTTVVLLAGGLGLFAQNAAAQTKVTGTIVDATGIGIPGATVIQAGTNNGAVADIDGKFEINVPQGANLQISCIGYETLTVKATGTTLSIVLQDDTNLLEEVVVTGYGGTQRRAKLTNSIAKVDEKTFAVGAHTNPASALSGAVSGLRVVQSSGDPTKMPTIVLRGGTNLDGSGSPLVIVDGQIRDSMEDINGEDIESMEVLKDAGATAIYGARASNGVILITTKKGHEGTAEVSFKSKIGFNYAYLPYDFCDARDYITWMRKAYNDLDGTAYGNYVANLSSNSTAFGIGRTSLSSDTVFNIMEKTSENSYLLGKGWEEMVDPITQKNIIFKSTNPADYNINSPAVSQDYNVGVSGGNDRGTYYTGIGYNDTDGVAQTTYYKRLSFVFNGTYKITDWLSSKSSVNFSRTKYRSMTATNGTESSYFGRIMSTPPTIRFEDEDGNMLLGNSTGDGNQNFQNDKFLRDYENDKLTLAQGFTARLLPGLTANVNANWYYNEDVNESFNKDYKTNQAGTGVNKTRSSSASFARYFTQTYNATLQYQKDLGNHSFDILAGTEYYDRAYKAFSASGSGAPTDDFQDLEYTSSDEKKRTIDSAHSQYRILSYFGRVNYDYAGKYLLSATFREDGYSSLLTNRWGFFPGVSAGWVFGKEDFVRDLMPALSFGKLRMSYGINGNASGIGAYTLQGSYSPASYNGNVGFLIGNLPNPTLRWEKTNTFELGVDVSFLENKLNANFTYYNRLTDDKYAALSLPSTTGFSSVQNNNGQFRNKGLEIELSYKIIQKKDLYLDVRGNITYNKNIVVKLPDNGLERNRQGGVELYTGADKTSTEWYGGYQEGQEPGMIYGYKVLGMFRSASDIPDNYEVRSGQWNGYYQYGPGKYNALTAAEKSKAVAVQPGDFQFADINDDGIIDSKDQIVIGNTTPHWTGGFNTTFRWKNLSFYGRFDYALGFYTMDSNANSFRWFLGCMQGAYNMPTEVWDTWTPENPNAKYPRYVFADQFWSSNYYRDSDFWSSRGDYLAIRELSLSYAMPKVVTDFIHAKKLEFSITGQNLGYITASKVCNPEVGGTSSAAYALPRTLLLGVNLTF